MRRLSGVLSGALTKLPTRPPSHPRYLATIATKKLVKSLPYHTPDIQDHLGNVKRYFDSFLSITKEPPSPLQITIPERKLEPQETHAELEEKWFDDVKTPEGITKDDMIRITREMIMVLRDQELVGRMLQNLDRELKEALKQAGISDEELKIEPQYLVPGLGSFFLGPPPEGQKPNPKIYEIFEKVLLEHKRQFGINTQYDSVVFLDYVEPSHAAQIIGDGNVFSDSPQVANMFMHGPLSHDLQILILSEALKEKKIDLSFKDEQGLRKTLNMKGLLWLMGKAPKIWEAALDNNADIKEPEGDPQNFTSSFRSPNSTQSLLSCFGEEMGLPTLGHGMRHMFWNEADKIIAATTEKHQIKVGSEISYGDIYLGVMTTIMISNHGSSGITVNPFTQSKEEAGKELIDRGYQELNPGVFVVRPRTNSVKPQAAPLQTTTQETEKS